ncbi:hypothetical protein LP7551_02199 [Roseibium album]|nr:hypothetical protein LP7551_02199 [Roseibium album]
MVDRAERHPANSLNLIRLIPAEGFEMSTFKSFKKIHNSHLPGAMPGHLGGAR